MLTRNMGVTLLLHRMLTRNRCVTLLLHRMLTRHAAMLETAPLTNNICDVCTELLQEPIQDELHSITCHCSNGSSRLWQVLLLPSDCIVPVSDSFITRPQLAIKLTVHLALEDCILCCVIRASLGWRWGDAVTEWNILQTSIHDLPCMLLVY